MKDKQIALTPKQMKHLHHELGLKCDTASMWWEVLPTGSCYLNILEDETQKLLFWTSTDTDVCYYPALTVQDLFDMLPKVIKGVDETTQMSVVCGLVIERDIYSPYKYNVMYNRNNISEDYVQLSPDFKDESLLNSAYQMLCWCAENGYIDKNFLV